MSTNSERITRRYLWIAAGWLAIAHIVLIFAGTISGHSLQLGDSPATAADALVKSSMASSFAGGYLSYLGFLVFLVGGLLFAQLLRGDDIVPRWLSSCIAGSVVAYVAVTISTGFAAGAAALYDGHHGADLSTVTTVNDIRNLGFILCAGLVGIFAVSVGLAARATGALPRWVTVSGVLVGSFAIVSVPACTHRRHRCVDDALLPLVRRRGDRGAAPLPPRARLRRCRPCDSLSARRARDAARFHSERRLERRDGRGDHRGHRGVARRSQHLAVDRGGRRPLAAHARLQRRCHRRVHDRRGGRRRRPTREPRRLGDARRRTALVTRRCCRRPRRPRHRHRSRQRSGGGGVRGHRLGAARPRVDDRHVGGARARSPTAGSAKRVGSGYASPSCSSPSGRSSIRSSTRRQASGVLVTGRTRSRSRVCGE